MKVEVQRTFKKIFKAKYENDRICVLAHWLLPKSEIQKILSENVAWFRQKQGTKSSEPNERAEAKNDLYGTQVFSCDSSQKKSKNDVENEISQGRKTLICGEIYEVRSSLVAKTRLEDKCLYVFEEAFGDRAMRIRSIKSFLRRFARESLSEKVSQVGCEMSLCPTKIEFRELSGEWLACSEAAKRVICLDYRVCQLPETLQRLVIVHAFAHFDCEKHDKDFFAAAERYFSDFSEYEYQLRSYDFLLKF